MGDSLPWFRADTNLPTNDKIIELAGAGARGKAAGFVYFCSIAWAVGHGTDGLIRRAALPFIHGTTSDAKLLVEAGLWDADPDGWRIHNFGTRQVVGAIQQVIQDGLSETRAAAGRKGAEKRWGGKS